ncbi:MAG: DUF4115 domain-containing protein [Gammaproteobacteria bacterium]|nr:DUF4115 domain-containing protein [Gammaproteobacteria bacterium]
MGDEHDKSADDNPGEESSELRGGERLAAARREQQISVLEVAKELHLDEPKVRALERNDFDVLGAPVFAKGHLRKYAQLVGVDADDVFTDYYQMTRSESLPPVVVSGRPRMRREMSPGPWIAVIIVILVAAAAYWWFAVQSESTAVPDSILREILPQEQSGEVADAAAETVVLATSLPNEQREFRRPDDLPVATQAATPQAPTTPVDGESRLTLVYSGDCWTEISDATGRRLYFDMGRSGSSVELTGEPPFSALLGNVDNVDVSVNGVDYPITSTNPGGRMARLTIMNP